MSKKWRPWVSGSKCWGEVLLTESSSLADGSLADVAGQLGQGRHFFAQFLRVPPYHPVSYSSTKGTKVTKGPLKDLKTASNQKGVPGFDKEDFSPTF